MEKKKKKDSNNKQALESNECLSKEDQNPSVKGKNQQVTSPQNDNVPSVAQHYPPAAPASILQWPYTPQPTLKPSISNQQTSTIVPLNPSWPQQQHGLSHSQMNHSTTGSWLPPGQGFPIARAPGTAAGFQFFVPMGAAEASLRNDPHNPSFGGYQCGFPHPLGYPGPWDPSSWWAQAQQSYTYPGANGYFAALPPLPFLDNLTQFGRPHQRGIIQPQPKLSHKHQQMWEAQSSQNAQLWAAISQLQAEMTSYGSRLMKLESEVSSLKSTVEAYSAAGTGTATGTGIGIGIGIGTKTGKRGRPRKVASADILLPYTDESQPQPQPQPQPRGRKIISCKAESQNKALHMEKESLNLEKSKASQVERIGTAANIGGFSLSLSKQTKESDNNKLIRNSRTDELSLFQSDQQVIKGANIEITSTTYKDGNGNYGWASSILPEDCGRNLLDMRSHFSHAYYDNGSSIIRDGGNKVIPGWSFANDGNPSEEHGDSMAVRSGKEEEEEDEMEEDANSGNDETDHRGGSI